MCAAESTPPEHNRKTAFLNIRLEPELRRELVLAARRNERTIAGEIRTAVRAYLDSLKEAA